MKYVADDGTEFTTEQECLAYEKKMEDILYSYIMFNKDVNVIANDDFNNLEYLYILDNAEDVCDYIYNETGWKDGINGRGIYRLNEDGDFEAVDGLISDYLSKAQMVTEVKNKIIKI